MDLLCRNDVGKSTIAQSLAIQFVNAGHKVVVIDADEPATAQK